MSLARIDLSAKRRKGLPVDQSVPPLKMGMLLVSPGCFEISECLNGVGFPQGLIPGVGGMRENGYQIPTNSDQ